MKEVYIITNISLIYRAEDVSPSLLPHGDTTTNKLQWQLIPDRPSYDCWNKVNTEIDRSLVFCLKNALLIKASRDMVSLLMASIIRWNTTGFLQLKLRNQVKKKKSEDKKKKTITRLQKKIARGWISVSFKVYAFAPITLWIWLPWESVSRLCSTLRKI